MHTSLVQLRFHCWNLEEMSLNKYINKNQGDIAPNLWFLCITKVQCRAAGWCCTFITAFLHQERQQWEYTTGALASDTPERGLVYTSIHTHVYIHICMYTHVKIPSKAIYTHTYTYNIYIYIQAFFWESRL